MCRQLREHLPTVTLDRYSRHFRDEVIASKGGIMVTLGGNYMEYEMMRLIPI
jgi:hypothetical protein